ncbi:type II toxin-antitoxin system RelE/ParE family toxin [Agrobacterium rhizogenes]|uniref:type II toxin-antitoxin system RelE/ParE family toxin n=1 Tax=Rhizobium rhizogenes TaxID=359 RepID=UPI0015726C79|nr:type II toxin-antitoxin system RelE/ParE family toxin [Rhizobium rhizogenes]NTG46489.1 type II toxin-antitoxin system RelE/ParE family toxin [Rhizobium rhizogenes]
MKLIVKPSARSDILEQLRYYTDAGGDDVGDRFFVGIRQSLSAITQTPLAGSPRHFDNPALDGLRSRVVSGFETIRVYYLIRDEAIIVVRILHGRRDLQALLSEDGGMT